MTTTRKPIKRETLERHRGAEIVIELHPTHMELRHKRKRTSYGLTYGEAFDFAAKLLANKVRLEKIEARKRARKRA